MDIADADVSQPGTAARDPVAPGTGTVYLSPTEAALGTVNILHAAGLGMAMGGPPGALAAASGTAATAVAAALARGIATGLAEPSATDVATMVPMDLQRDAPSRHSRANRRDASGTVIQHAEAHDVLQRRRQDRARNAAMQAKRDKRAQQSGMGAAERIVQSALQGTAVGTGLGFVAGGGNPLTGVAGGVIGTAAGAVSGIVNEVSSALRINDGKRARVSVRLAPALEANADEYEDDQEFDDADL